MSQPSLARKYSNHKLDAMTSHDVESSSTGMLSMGIHDSSTFENGTPQLALRADIFGETVAASEDLNRDYEFLVNVKVWDKRRRGSQSIYEQRNSFYIAVTRDSLSVLKGNSRTQVSLLKNVAELYDVSPYDFVSISKIDNKNESEVLAETCEAEFVTVSVKDQFISRGEMYYFHSDMIDRWVYEGERISLSSDIRANIDELRKGTEKIRLGVVTENTKITVRSRSSRIIWLVQISTEMWDYASPYETATQNQYGSTEGTCQIYFDKFVKFMNKTFERWKEIEVTHSLTVIFFGRTYLTSQSNQLLGRTMSDGGRLESAVYRDSDGRLYEDHYKIVIENETRTDWTEIVYKVKKAMNEYPRTVDWNTSSGRFPSAAAQGNVLEAINVTLNMLQFHYMDRDLKRMGNSLVIVSAGAGVFEVNRELAAITKQRMMDNGIGSDMLSLSLPPLHVSPFFCYKEFEANINVDHEDASDWKSCVECPHWMHLSFVNYDQDGSRASKTETEDEEKKVDCLTIGANGFVMKYPRTKCFRKSTNEEISENVEKGKESKRVNPQHMISGREFADILEACRPRNRGDSVKLMPSALKSLLRKNSVSGQANKTTTYFSKGQKESEEKESFSPLHEWGAVDIKPEAVALADLDEYTHSSDSVSLHSSNSFSFVSRSMELLDSYLDTSRNRSKNVLEIQPSVSLDKNIYRSKRLQGEDISSIEVQQKNELEARDLQKRMDEYNAEIFTCTPKDEKQVSDRVTQMNSSIRKGVLRTSSADLTDLRRPMSHKALHLVSDTAGGIEAALAQFSSHSSGLKRIVSARKIVKSQSIGHLGLRSPITSRFHTDSPGANVDVSMSPLLLANTSNADPPERLVLPATSSSVQLNDSKSGNGGFYVGSLQDCVDGYQHVRASKTLGINVTKSTHNSIHHSHHSNQSLCSSTTAHRFPYNNPIQQANKSSPATERLIERRLKQVKSNTTRRLNPFREQDEEHVLAEYSHSRRRWSHVFPLGETEFKKGRTAGPNWKSLCQPATLPMTIDHFPFLHELNDLSKFTFKHYRINLDAMDNKHYKSHLELLKEMIVQRLIQNFQLVPRDVLNGFTTNMDRNIGSWHSLYSPQLVPRRMSDMSLSVLSQSKRRTMPSRADVRYALSMGHRIHILSYNENTEENTEEIEVIQYQAVATQNHSYNCQTYKYLLWSSLSQKFLLVKQTFNKYESEYRWNKLDNILCGDPEESLTEDSRYRRISFAIIPKARKTTDEEQLHIQNFQRLIEYLNRLLCNEVVDIKIEVNDEKRVKISNSKVSSRRRHVRTITRTKRYTIKLSKDQEKYQWMNIVLGATFSARRTFHISFCWLVASGAKVGKHVQMLSRRASQFGLKFITVPQYALSQNMYLHPLITPTLVIVANKRVSMSAETFLTESQDFVDDGQLIIDSKDLEQEQAEYFEFQIDRYGHKKLNARQYAHETGCVFVRVLEDARSRYGFFWIENRRMLRINKEVERFARSLFKRFVDRIDELKGEGLKGEGRKPIVACEDDYSVTE